ncbi:hypothetical protein [Nocardia tengchongensis]|uniref:hypothetical protein n=1 Tax=Nocardia tengchongensis TaxID=2055889 RepID=UPI00360ED6C8
MVHIEIQTAVDLLGRGTTEPPPPVDDPSTEQIITDLGQGSASQPYQQAMAQMKSRQDALVQLDDQVLQVANVVAAGKDQTLAAIQRIVERTVTDLQAKSAALGTQTLLPAQESDLMLEVSDTVDAVYAQVDKAAAANKQMAGGGQSGGSNGGAGSGTGTGAGTGAGSGDSGMSGIMSGLMSMLQMLPIVGISMLPELIKLLKPDDKKSNTHHDDQQHPDAKTPGQPGAPQADPNTPAVTAPGSPGSPAAADPNAPTANAPQSNVPA